MFKVNSFILQVNGSEETVYKVWVSTLCQCVEGHCHWYGLVHWLGHWNTSFTLRGGGEGRYSNKFMVKSSNAQSIAWGRGERGNVGAWNCRMHYVRYLKIILKIISRNKFKKSLFIWLSTQPQIRRSFDYYFMTHLQSLNSLPVYRHLNILLLFLVLLQS